VTLCIAVHCADGSVIALSDRMLSRGDDARHLPPIAKRYQLHEGVHTLWAGGNSLSNGIINAAGTMLGRKFSPEQVTGHRAAQALREAYEAARIVEGASQLLPTYLLSGLDEYHAKRPTLPRATVSEIEHRMVRWHFPEAEDPAFIVFGVDPSGSHIFKVFREYPYRGEPRTRVDWHDGVGFASIGGNTEPADQLLFDRQAWHQPFGVALMLAYIAAQYCVSRDDGIGPPEDILVVGPGQDECFGVDNWGHFHLKRLYDATITGGHGGLETALQVAGQFKREPGLGIVMPPGPAGTPAPARPEGSTPDSSPPPPSQG